MRWIVFCIDGGRALFFCIVLDKIRKKNFDKTRAIISDFADTYKETSVSGDGVHIFAKGSITKNVNNRDDRFEMYKSNKCITITGDVIGICTEIYEYSKPKR